MNPSKKLFLITSNAESGTLETLPITENMEIISHDQLLQSKIFFSEHDKVSITSEASIETIINSIDNGRKQAILALKNKFVFRNLLTGIYPDFQFKLIKIQDMESLKIKERSVVKPVKGCFGTAVRTVDTDTDFGKLKSLLEAELLKNGNVLSENVLSQEDFIVEQFLEGEEYAVDMFYDSEGNPCIVNIYHHPMPQNKAYLHMIYYSSKAVFNKIYIKAKLFFTALNEVLKVRNFVMHAEFKENKGQLMPIEINTMRFGGMGLGNMIFHTLGINPYSCFLQDREPDWQTIWSQNKNEVFSFFIAYNADKKPIDKFKPNREKLKQQFSQILLEQAFDYQKQLAFGIYCLKETEENIAELLKIEFDDFFEEV